MQFDWTINFGTLIPIMSFLIYIVYKIAGIETKVNAMWQRFIRQ